jgi:hypothetical protein
MKKPASPRSWRFSLVATVRELLVMHDFAATAHVEGAAFFAAPQSARRCVSAEDRGVSDPGFSPANFAPGDGTRVAYARNPCVRCLPSALSVFSAIVRAPA